MAIGSSMSSMNTSCLVDASVSRSVISLHMCGNGIVEPGEDCDPGFGRNSICCDSATCKFTHNAVCDPEDSDCCTPDCHFAHSTQLCRPILDAVCDQPGMCSGTNSSCPVHHTKPNGAVCGAGLACATGICTSLDREPSLRKSLIISSDLAERARTMSDCWCIHESHHRLQHQE